MRQRVAWVNQGQKLSCQPAHPTSPLCGMQAGPSDWLVATFTTPPVSTVESMMVIYAGGGVYKNGAIRQAVPGC